VLVRGDVIALRYALLIEHLRPGVRLVVTLFDRTISDQLVRSVPNCVVTSPADCVVPGLVTACVGEVGVGPSRSAIRGWLEALRSQARPHDVTTRILLIGAVGLVASLCLDWIVGALVFGQGAIRSLFVSTRVVAGVGPGASADAPTWYLALSTFTMLVTIVFTAMFTAGVVNRLHSSRSIVLFGSRTVPTRDHVVVVGLGQIGLRLCLHLRKLSIPVVAVERDPRAVNLRLARQANVPVLIAHAEDRVVLERVGLRQARALAAMGSEDLDNVEVAIAALAVAPEVRVLIRAGESDVISESRSLFSIGHVCDVAAATSRAVVANLVDTAIEPHSSAARCEC
jgi:hypothetical protein